MVTKRGDYSLSILIQRKNRIDAVRNSSLPDDEGEALEKTHGIHLRFGGTIDRAARNRRGAGNRTDIDDAAGRAELFNRFLRCENQAENIQVELPVEMLLRDAFKRKEFKNARVVHENVKLAE